MLSLLFALSLAQTQAAVPRLERTECFQVIRRWTDSIGVECAWLVVPELRNRPNGRTIRLPVAMRRVKNATLPPLVVLHGGPGGVGLIITSSVQAFLSAPRKDRDVILFDQRGAGLSEPKICPDVASDSVVIRGDTALTPQHRWDMIARACVASMKRAGIEPAAYSTIASAADVVDLRRTLGYAKWDIYGVSYGGRLAFEMMRYDPAGTRAVVVESALIPGPAPHAEDPIMVQRSLERVFAACAAQPACHALVPALEQDFYSVYDSLEAAPLEVSWTTAGATNTVQLDGKRFLRGMRCQLSGAPTVARIPLLVNHLRRGDRMRAAQILAPPCAGSLGFNPTIMLVTCFDVWGDAQRRANEAAKGQSRPMFQLFEEGGEECNIWQERFADPSNLELVRSDIPTLLIAGEFDERTPPEHSRRAAALLPKSFFFEVPGGSHGMPPNACTDSIVVRFYRNPLRKPDASCLASMRVTFETKSLDIPNFFIVITGNPTTSALEGTWAAEYPGAPRRFTVRLEAKGGIVTGVIDPMRVAIFDGRIDGQTITFKTKGPDNLRTITFTGKLAGDSIAFARDVVVSPGAPEGGRGPFGLAGARTFTARRVP